ncbi:hypothetical protein K470DRAFT_256461 [Piedraia hortae CBS 480.64]|uniref:Maintenance of mitochondrial morphology protein 1 n=1 Tax=Piedraia hortae CBS 480.64 TaxID=1314780 RepID=A0A6A7C3J1_9PEZI|nr:hypothetical protein K470DRAFT_256461 [Piedraia hortae CBS 480.64]
MLTTAAHSSQPTYGFAAGFLCGQLVLALILFAFIKFFIFGEPPSADERAQQRAASRKQRTLTHTRRRTLSTALRPRSSRALVKGRDGPTVQKLLEKTFYGAERQHEAESLDWFNVLVAQAIAQLRTDALEDEAVLTSLNALLNSPSKPDFVDDIRVAEVSLGDEFPIFSNCRIIPVDEHGVQLAQLTGNVGERLQAQMDVELSDVLTLGIETRLLLNYPMPFVATLPVALAVTVERFSGTLSLSFLPSSSPTADLSSPSATPTTLTFTFLDDYRLDLSIHSLIGSRSRLQDVPKIAQLVENRIHQWFDDRCVEPRFQQIVLPSLWPRKKTTRGGDEAAVDDDGEVPPMDVLPSKGPAAVPVSKKETALPVSKEPAILVNGSETNSEQRTREWAAKHGKPRDEMSELELAGAEMREADERSRRKVMRAA